MENKIELYKTLIKTTIQRYENECFVLEAINPKENKMLDRDLYLKYSAIADNTAKLLFEILEKSKDN